MNPLPAPALSGLEAALCLIFILLIPFAMAGLALINCGLGRSRNAAHAMMGPLLLIGIAVIVYFVVGFSWQGYLARPAYALVIDGKPWSWIASEPFFWRGIKWDGSPDSLAALFGLMSVSLLVTIPLGSGAERWRLGSACVSTILLAGWTFPLFAHWVWGGGWLAQLGVNYGLGQGFLDSGGASTIQVIGGLTALAITWVLRPRGSKYTREGMPIAMPGHNAVLILFGCSLAWIGWMGLDSAGAMLFTGAEGSRTVLIAANATIAAVSALLAAAAITRIRFGKPDASLSANGWVAGLVASSAGCAVIRPAEAMIIGLVAGALVVYSVELFELHLTIDDPGGSISVHAVAGLWGILATGWFARVPGGPDYPNQATAQLLGIATLLGFVLPMTYGLNWLLNRVMPMRVAAYGERQGMDLHELGSGAYPDFMSHNEDYLQR